MCQLRMRIYSYRLLLSSLCAGLLLQWGLELEGVSQDKELGVEGSLGILSEEGVFTILSIPNQ